MSTANRLPDPDGADFDWQTYEEIVKDIYQALGRVNGATVECSGRNCRVHVAGGVRRQVDVLITHINGDHRYRTAISCKWWNKRVGVDHVSDFALTVQDAQLDAGIIVSKMGFTGPAQDLAQAKSIRLFELRKPLDADWDGSITHVHGEIVFSPPHHYQYTLRMTKPGPDPRADTDQGRPMNFASSPDRFVITDPSGHSKTLFERAREAQPQVEDGTAFTIDFPDGTTLTMPDEPDHVANGALLHSASVQVNMPAPMTTEIDVDAADLIYMIMESVFDGRRFNITNDGEITEVH